MILYKYNFGNWSSSIKVIIDNSNLGIIVIIYYSFQDELMIIERIALSSAFLYFVHLYFAGCASERVTDVALSEINEWMFKKKGICYIFYKIRRKT